MQSKRISHEELQKNIPDLISKSEERYLYHEGYVYYSFCLPGGGADATGWMNGGEVFKRAKDDGTEITTFDKTFEESVTTASSSHVYYYYVPRFEDGYVHFSIEYENDNDVEGKSVSYLKYKVKADGISDLEF
jgi:hypothetical protein